MKKSWFLIALMGICVEGLFASGLQLPSRIPSDFQDAPSDRAALEALQTTAVSEGVSLQSQPPVSSPESVGNGLDRNRLAEKPVAVKKLRYKGNGVFEVTIGLVPNPGIAKVLLKHKDTTNCGIGEINPNVTLGNDVKEFSFTRKVPLKQPYSLCEKYRSGIFYNEVLVVRKSGDISVAEPFEVNLAGYFEGGVYQENEDSRIKLQLDLISETSGPEKKYPALDLTGKTKVREYQLLIQAQPEALDGVYAAILPDGRELFADSGAELSRLINGAQVLVRTELMQELKVHTAGCFAGGCMITRYYAGDDYKFVGLGEVGITLVRDTGKPMRVSTFPKP